MTSIEANENVPETPALQPVGDFRAFLREEIGTFTVVMFFMTELLIVINFWSHRGAANGFEIFHFCIMLLLPILIFRCAFRGYSRVKETLGKTNLDPKDMAKIFDVIQGLTIVAFLTIVISVNP